MRTLAPSLEFASRLGRACLVALYSAIALLGSGGLHAIAPKCQSACCAAESPVAHSHQGCSHHHHAQCPATDTGRQQPDKKPARCPNGCLICEFAATPAVTVALVEPPPLLASAGELAPPAGHRPPAEPADLFWIRGPPALG